MPTARLLLSARPPRRRSSGRGEKPDRVLLPACGEKVPKADEGRRSRFSSVAVVIRVCERNNLPALAIAITAFPSPAPARPSPALRAPSPRKRGEEHAFASRSGYAGHNDRYRLLGNRIPHAYLPARPSPDPGAIRLHLGA